MKSEDKFFLGLMLFIVSIGILGIINVSNEQRRLEDCENTGLVTMTRTGTSKVYDCNSLDGDNS